MAIDWKEIERVAHELCSILENEFIQVQTEAESRAIIENARLNLINWGILEFRNTPEFRGEDSFETSRRLTISR